uniref:Calponin-homology (CH) domain-containing protein n=1 Tax=Hemiselmis andersenii TaxID=464988 RepID=A0A7S1DS89_HEMAN|mmetsp:Transcript_25591/g.62199  ORF Transcript_25591/g.62199 Transcript_25591/m.62199 type:complete len:568 (+) Transcript_25591:59-1762(+)
MEIIKRWLSDDIGVTIDPSDGGIERDFANGFAFALVMKHYNIQPDFDKFVNKHNPDVKLANFQRLQPSFRALNIRFDSHTANQLMTEEPGCAAALLGKLKVALDMPTGSKTRASTGKSSQKGSTSLLLQTNRLASKEKFRDMEEQTFDKTLRLKTADPKEYRMSHQLRAFEEEAIRQQYNAELGDAQARLEYETHLADSREAQRAKSKENRAYLDDWERQGWVNHAKNQAAKKERERRDLRVELSQQEKARRKRAMESDTAADEVVHGIDHFEESLRRIQDQTDADVPDDVLAQTSTETPDQFLAALTSKVPSGAALKKESELYMKKVQERRGEEALARKERDRRRRRVLVEQMRTHKDMEVKRREAMLSEKISRQSTEEQRIAEKLHAALEEKEVMRQARLRREQRYIALRQQQYVEVSAADARKYALMREDYQAQLANNRATLEEMERKEKAARSQKHYNACRGIADQIVDLAVKVCHYRAVTDSALVPPKQWREWAALFTAGMSLFPDDLVEEEEEKLPEEVDVQAVLVDKRDYCAYVELVSEWAPKPPPKEEGEEGGEDEEEC